MVTSQGKQAATKKLQTSKNDTGSSDVQVSQMTNQIKNLTDHLKINKKDFAARRGLMQLVGKRRRLLRYIADKDEQAYYDLIQKLGIRR